MEKMKRLGPYADTITNPYASSEMQRMSVKKMQPDTGSKAFQGMSNMAAAGQGHLYASSRIERQWNSHRNEPTQIPPHPSAEAQDYTSRTLSDGRIVAPKVDIERQAIMDPRHQPQPQSQSFEEDMEIGYEDKPSSLSFEDLERRFMDEIMKLVKEQNDMEDGENTRHRERLTEINRQYQEKLASLRAQQASQREEFLRKEFQARGIKYQQDAMNNPLTRTGTGDPNGYNVAAMPSEAARQAAAHPTAQFDTYRERQSFPMGARSVGRERRVPYPEGRVYNNHSGFH